MAAGSTPLPWWLCSPGEGLTFMQDTIRAFWDRTSSAVELLIERLVPFEQTLFAAYLDAKQRQHVLDYDDLLLYWAQMMCEPAIAEDVAGRFDHVLVDEYQDTNRLQASILLKLKPDGRGLTVVGDDVQSIYLFRAATVRNILEFPGQFREPAVVVTLTRNYRSTEPILAASNAVISLARNVLPRTCGRGDRRTIAPGSSRSPRRSIRRATWPDAYWRTARAVPH
jgi:superfamily I DNA/RNA helicase